MTISPIEVPYICTKLVILLQWGLTTTAEIPQQISLLDQ